MPNRHEAHRAPYVPVAGDLIKLVTPNIHAKNAKTKTAFAFAIAGIPICMVLFMLGGALSGVISFGFMALTLIGFVGFGICGMVLNVLHLKKEKYKHLIILLDEIKMNDKSIIDNLSITRTIGKNSVIGIIRKLIETKNLEDYEIIGDIGVAQKSLQARVSDFAVVVNKQVIMTAQQEPQRPPRCSSCGAAVKQDSGRFCAFCGTKL